MDTCPLEVVCSTSLVFAPKVPSMEPKRGLQYVYQECASWMETAPCTVS